MAKPSTKGLLKEILSDDIEWVYINITKKAVEWIAAGFIDEANQLLEQLWKFNIPHSGHLWLTDQGLQIIWQVSGKQPNGIPFQLTDISKLSEIEKDNWLSNFHPTWHESYTSNFINKPIEELEGHELFAKAIIAFHERSENVDKTLNAIKRYIENDDPVGHHYFQATTCGSLLAARHDYHYAADYFITLWGKGYLQHWVNYTLNYLMRDRKAAECLLKGTLAPVFKLTHAKIQKETKEIIDALSNRMERGRTLVYKKLSWKQLLDKISKMALKQKTMEFSQDILKRKSLRRAPATEEEIGEVEKKLNIILPEDYKMFLLSSNGFECFVRTGVTLAPVDKINFLIKVDKELVDIWADSMDDLDPTYGHKLESSLIIGGHGEEQCLLLIPLNNDNWECWHFSSWAPGEAVYESFRFYMEGELHRLEDGLYVD